MTDVIQAGVAANVTPADNPAIRVTRLPSGLTVVTERMDRVETVSLGAYVATGTRHETAEENGVSHFLEHMAFKGTERRSAAAIAEEIEAVGGHINAYTAREQTAYYVKVLKEDTALGADIIGDILSHSTFDPRRAGARARRDPAGDRPGQRHARRHHLRPFPGDRLPGPADGPAGAGHRGRHPRHAARRADELHAPPLRRRPTRWSPAAGNLEHDRVRRPGRASTSPTCRREPAPAAVPGTYDGGEFREARDLDQVHIVLGFPSVAYADPDYYPTMLLSTLLGGGMSSRLFQEVREKRGLVYSVYSFTAPSMDGGLFGIYAGTGESEAAELMPVTLDELQKVQHEVTEAELGRARAQVKAGAADVAGKHRQPLRAAGPPDAGVRPRDPDRRDGGQDRRGDGARRAARRRPHVPRGAHAGRDGPGRDGCRGCPPSPTGWRHEHHGS